MLLLVHSRPSFETRFAGQPKLSWCGLLSSLSRSGCGWCGWPLAMAGIEAVAALLLEAAEQRRECEAIRPKVIRYGQDPPVDTFACATPTLVATLPALFLSTRTATSHGPGYSVSKPRHSISTRLCLLSETSQWPTHPQWLRHRHRHRHGWGYQGEDGPWNPSDPFGGFLVAAAPRSINEMFQIR